MGADIELDEKQEGPFDRYSDEIIIAARRAVREALLMHKRLGNPVAVARDGKVVILEPDEIEVD